MNRRIREAGRGLCAFLFVITLVVLSVLPVYADTADRKSVSSGAKYSDAGYADAKYTDARHAGAGYTSAAEAGYATAAGGAAWEEGTTHSLDFFDRIAVNSVRGFLTIRTGEEFSIWLPDGWDGAPGFSVQDDILVVSGRISNDAGSEKSGSAVVLGEDEPGEGRSAQGSGAGRSGTAGGGETSADSGADAASGSGSGTSADSGADVASGNGSGNSAAGMASEGGSENSAGDTNGGSDADGGTDADGVMHEIVITIPAGSGLDTLRVAMESGDLFLTDITAGSVTIQSGGGNLILRDVSLGTVDIYTEAGEVSMADGSFGTLNIGMGEGEVTVSADDELSECRMELKTGDGEITVSGSPEGDQYMQPGNGKRSLTVQVVSGDIRVDG